MLLSGRFLSLIVVGISIFSLWRSHPRTIPKGPEISVYNADTRLARWIETTSTPVDGGLRSPISHHNKQRALHRYLETVKSSIVIDPFPLGKPNVSDVSTPTLAVPGTFDFVDAKFSFQEEVMLKPPKMDLGRYNRHSPHNFDSDSRQPTFATFFSTKNSSLQDPYFAATLSLVYRNLWSPNIASRHYPFTVFVPPFINQRQRDILSGAGAIIKELETVHWRPNVDGVWARWSDQFSKLHMWNKTEFSRVAFMDADAFPVKNIDDVFDLAHQQKCIRSKLSAEDGRVAEDICDYHFAGVDISGQGYPNGGFLILEPNTHMHDRLMRNYKQLEKYDNSAVEQGFLGWQFGVDGPFPMQSLPRKYNGLFPQSRDEGKLSVVHEKLWNERHELPSWLRGRWMQDWDEMITYFSSQEFADARKKDGKVDASKPIDDRKKRNTNAQTVRQMTEQRLSSRQEKDELGKSTAGETPKNFDGQKFVNDAPKAEVSELEHGRLVHQHEPPQRQRHARHEHNFV